MQTSDSIPVEVGPIQFLAPWEGSYTKLERWEEGADPKAPHPEVLDILCLIENKGDRPLQHGDLIVITIFDYVVAPTYMHSGDLKRIIDEVAWTRVGAVDDVKLDVVPYLEPKGTTNVKIEAFNLGSLMKQFEGKGETLCRGHSE